MRTENRTLGTLLRHMVDLLDDAVEQGYVRAGLEYRPRYTPIMRALIERGPASIRLLARYACLTHSAASQTIAQMAKAGLVEIKPGTDAREHIISLSAKATEIIPALHEIWRATNAAAGEFDAELPFPLSHLLEKAIKALEHRSFADRREAHQFSERISE